MLTAVFCQRLGNADPPTLLDTGNGSEQQGAPMRQKREREMEASITFETCTPESLEQGDHADHGWIAPNEYRVSLGMAGRNYSKRVRMAQRGRYDWRLGDAVRFILGKLSNGQSMVDVDCQTWRPGRSWTLSVQIERCQEDEQCEETVGYELHLSGLSQGTADRLEALFINAGCRRPFARASSLRRVG